jgi:HSP20 family protein
MLWSDLERFGRLLDPWREFERLNRGLTRGPASTADFPAFNVWMAADNAVVTSEIPGIDSKDIEISVVGKTVTLRGTRAPEQTKEKEAYHRRERWHGRFSKTFELPFEVDADRVGAKYAKGILYIALPRAEADKPRKIVVKSE